MTDVLFAWGDEIDWADGCMQLVQLCGENPSNNSR